MVHAGSVPPRGPDIDIVVRSALWRGLPEAEAVIGDAVAAAAAALGEAVPALCELAVILTDDAAIRLLNKQWRGIDRPTNVLSFPASGAAAPSGAPQILGDVVMAFECLEREAKEAGKPMTAHLAHLTVHGVLHLFGYDHEREDEADAMERLETHILSGLGISDPYAEAALPRAIARR